MTTITGDKKIDRKIRHLKGSGQRRIARAMLGAQMTAISRGIRRVIPPRQKSVKKALGRRNKRNKKTDEYEAKVGLGVGKQSKSKKQRDPKKPGVGITKANVHWLILGTDHRFTRNAEYTGKVDPSPEWVKQGVLASKADAFRKARDVGLKKLRQEARKG